MSEDEPFDLARLWVDDERAFPLYYNVWAQNSYDAIGCLKIYNVVEMSLDHDLGGDDTTRAVVLWLCEHPSYWPDIIHVHTANPIGRDWLVGMIDRYGPGVI